MAKLLVNPPVKFYSLSIALLVVAFSFLYMLYQLVEKLSDKSKQLTELNQQLEIKSEELVEINHKQSQFFTVIGHELRTPVISIKMMQDEMELEKLEPYGPNIVYSTKNVLSILDDFKFFTDNSSTSKNYVEVPSQLVERSIFSLSSLTRLNNVTVHFSHDETSDVFCNFNTKAIRQITTNLVKNSAIHAKAKNIWVSLEGQKLKNQRVAITLRVEDDGIGISDSNKDNIFEPFFRINANSPGTGLGLFICKQLTNQINGNIIFFSSPKGGAGFELQCRFNQDVSATAENIYPKLNRKPQNSYIKNKTILLVEDDPIILDLTRILLTDAGAQVMTAENGKVAMSIVDNEEIDIVLTDLMMPACDGFILTETLRTTGFNGFIIGITAAIYVDKQEKFAQAGGDYLLAKPIDMVLFENTVRFLESAK